MLSIATQSPGRLEVFPGPESTKFICDFYPRGTRGQTGRNGVFSPAMWG